MNNEAKNRGHEGFKAPTPRQDPLPRRFGVAKFGSRNRSALTIAVPGGIALTLALAAIATSLGSDHVRLAWGWVLLIFALCLLPVSVAAVWGFIVDRETIRGASRSPEENVENAWFNKASETTTLVTFAVAGLGSAVAAFVRQESAAVSFTLLGVCGFMAITFAVAYLWEKSRAA